MSTVRQAAPRQDARQLKDRYFKCVDCVDEFVWTASEQQYYHDKGLLHTPKRCHQCRGKRKEHLKEMEKMAVKPEERQKVEVRVNCAKCGVATTVPFYPSRGKAVYCRPCFLERQSG